MSVVCHEPAGTVNRVVRQLKPLPEEALFVYDKLATCPNLFGERPVSSLEQLIKDHWKFWLVDDVGVICFDPFIPEYAHIHITFWDRRLRGREELCRSVILFLMDRYKINMVVTAIPLTARVVTAFAKRAGLKPGVIREGRQVFWGTSNGFTMKHQGA